MKTFHTGPNGRTDHQLPDGTVVFTAPTGHTYTTEPHGATLFPALGQSTGDLTIPEPTQPTGGNRSVMKPTRRQTREQDRADRIAAERRERAELNAEQHRRHQQWLDTDAEPPPF